MPADRANSWYINFREKGDNPTVGGFFRADSIAERDAMTEYFKSFGLRVVYEPHPDNPASKGT